MNTVEMLVNDTLLWGLIFHGISVSIIATLAKEIGNFCVK